MQQILMRWDLVERKVLGTMAAFFFLVGIIVANMEIVRRYIFGLSFPWSEDLVVYPILVAVLLCFNITLKSGQHLRVTLLWQFMGKRVGLAARLFGDLVGCFTCLLLARYGLVFVQRMIATSPTTMGARIPFFIFYLVLVIVWILLASGYLQHTYRLIRGLEQEGE